MHPSPSLKLLNVRTQKWRSMLKHPPSHNLPLLLKRLRKGIPPCIRQLVWPHLLSLPTFKHNSHQNYSLLLLQHSPTLNEILLDIPRTHTQQNPSHMRLSLCNVLSALSLVYPELGYCQGMNHLTMKLLETLPDDTTFWVMNYIIRTQRNILWNYKNPSLTELQTTVLLSLVREHTPALYQALQRTKVPLLAVTPKWFITLFSSTLPEELFYRIFECFLVEGYQVVYKAAICVLGVHEKVMREEEEEEILRCLLDKGGYEGVDVEGFCRKMHGLEFSNEDVELLEARFVEENREKVIGWQEEAQEYYQRRMEEGGRNQAREKEYGHGDGGNEKKRGDKVVDKVREDTL